ncbi:MAG: Bug family tripartite tricarboxylate transporter substrate binding protein [Burkholderiaceae bacterium]|jgi:tripartite-type tricarboxylate transporter receptor subunit TctC
MKFRNLLFLMLIGVLFAQPPVAHAQYPERPITLVVPWPTGGGTDTMGRIIAKGLSSVLGVPVVVENKGGANGTIGSRYVSDAPPNGYTLLMGSSGPLTVSSAVRPKEVPYDPLKDFTPVMLVAKIPLVLVVHPSVPAKTLQELVDLAKKDSKALTMASVGVGSSNHLTGAMFQSYAGIEMLHVPYKGAGPALTDLLGGQVDVYFDQIATSAPHIRSGKLRALAVTSLERSTLLPEIPSVNESGFAGFDTSSYYAIMLPPGAPDDVVRKLNSALIETVRMQDTKDSFARMGFEADESTPEELREFLTKDLSMWRKVAKDAGVEMDE